jgi:hypothetical protein
MSFSQFLSDLVLDQDHDLEGKNKKSIKIPAMPQCPVPQLSQRASRPGATSALGAAWFSMI